MAREALSKPGGRRIGQGRPSAFKSDQESLQAAAMEFLQDPKRLRILLETAYDRATGGGGMVLAKVKWTGAALRLIEEEKECRLSDGSVVYLYRERPDTSLLKSLIELGIGKAPTRGTTVQDTEIRVLTGVPRGKAARPEEEDEDEAE